MGSLIVLVLFFVSMGSLLFWFHNFEQKRSKELSQKIETIAEGRYSHMIYGSYKETRTSRRPGMASSPETHVYEMHASVVVMEDQTTYVLKGRRDMIYPSGTHIVVKQNGHGHRWVELAP